MSVPVGSDSAPYPRCQRTNRMKQTLNESYETGIKEKSSLQSNEVSQTWLETVQKVPFISLFFCSNPLLHQGFGKKNGFRSCESHYYSVFSRDLILKEVYRICPVSINV